MFMLFHHFVISSSRSCFVTCLLQVAIHTLLCCMLLWIFLFKYMFLVPFFATSFYWTPFLLCKSKSLEHHPLSNFELLWLLVSFWPFFFLVSMCVYVVYMHVYLIFFEFLFFKILCAFVCFICICVFDYVWFVFLFLFVVCL
jgi:hypothetical protein